MRSTAVYHDASHYSGIVSYLGNCIQPCSAMLFGGHRLRLTDGARRSAVACLLLQDNGKPVAVARAADIPLSVAHFRYFAGWADKITGAAQITGAS
jgi:hypothetical protein